ncbi:MAG TPA: TetR/AcrR family transcriptional regulator [Labilithrix sp.]|nr:TetR/AcrR family transcriptional regulator [Labilithrix sp.]
MARRYQSAVRDERASRTRATLLSACEALLLEGPLETVTLPAVARRAGVTKPTAYSYFPDNDALMAGFIEHLRGRIGMSLETLANIPPGRLPTAVRQNYRRFDQNAQLLLRIMDSPSYTRVRLARKIDRAGMAIPIWDRAAPEPVLRQRLGPIYHLVTPASWRWLRETWGLSGEDAARAAAWAMEVLTSALVAGPRKTKRDEAATSGRRRKRTSP